MDSYPHILSIMEIFRLAKLDDPSYIEPRAPIQGLRPVPIDKIFMPSFPMGIYQERRLLHRLKWAFMVFTGKADVLKKENP